jgi:diguanylate cyclase (GGDEF)-like protein
MIKKASNPDIRKKIEDVDIVKIAQLGNFDGEIQALKNLEIANYFSQFKKDPNNEDLNNNENFLCFSNISEYIIESIKTVYDCDNPDNDYFIKSIIYQVKIKFFDFIKNLYQSWSKDVEDTKENKKSEKISRLIAEITTIINDKINTTISNTNQIIELKKQIKEYQELAAFDKLTGAISRRFFEDIFEKIIGLLQRNRKEENESDYSCSILMFDLDHFKLINDNYGHPIGDKILKEFVKRINNTKRPNENIARLGGEEFIMILPNTGLEGAFAAASRFANAVNNKPFIISENREIQKQIEVSTSIGAFEILPEYFDRYNAKQIKEKSLEGVDYCLYIAKGKQPDNKGVIEDRRGTIIGGLKYDKKGNIIPGYVLGSNNTKNTSAQNPNGKQSKIEEDVKKVFDSIKFNEDKDYPGENHQILGRYKKIEPKIPTQAQLREAFQKSHKY